MEIIIFFLTGFPLLPVELGIEIVKILLIQPFLRFFQSLSEPLEMDDLPRPQEL